jgi:hypothetical protein
MMMTLTPPAARRRRRRRRAALVLAVAIAALGGGAWAASGSPARYVLVVMDARTGEIVSRGVADDLRLPSGVRPDWGTAADGVVRAAAGSLADLFAGIAEARSRESVPPAGPAKAPVLAGGLPTTTGEGLKIEIVDAWAQPGVMPAIGDAGEVAPPG